MSRVNSQEIQDIVAQLERLNLQQAELVQRLSSLNQSEEDNYTVQSAVAERIFAIGDRVRINNPNRLQAREGTIVKIGSSRITVETRGGSKIVRAPKNLTLIQSS